MTDSLDLHLDENGDLAFERSLLHAGIYIDLLDGRPRDERARVAFMAGGPASGKTDLARRLGLTEGAAVIDVDDIRLQLPEYRQWLRERPEDAARLTHREASQIAKLALGMALERGLRVVFDGVGGDDRGRFSEKIQAALDRGALVRVCYATTSVEVALEREAARFAESGRHVDADLLRAKHAEVSRGLATVAGLGVDLIEVYDTTGETPALLARGRGGAGQDALEAVDRAGYAAFLQKGAR